jgi:hypothetical protein
MTLNRGHLSWGVAVLLAFATAATAEPSAGEQVSRESESMVEGFCPASLCYEDSQCQAACTRDPNAYCGPNGTCVYPTTGGGGGGGGGFCPASLCMEDSQCVCKTGQGYCGPNGTCVY